MPVGGKTVTVTTIVAVFLVITSDETIFHQFKMSHFNEKLQFVVLPMMKT